MALALAAASFHTLAQSPAPTQPDPRAIVVEDVSRADFAATLKNLKEQLAADGWTLVAEINLGERLAKKNVAIPGGLVILEMTSGGNTVPLLKNEETRYVSALMPCSVSVYGMSDGRVILSRMNANLLAGMLDPRLAEAMKKSAAQLDASIARTLTKLGR
ncbi:MAG: DUF302 domain-containing protein [Hydrogenophilales bacterium]|nr:DUF302 domain-containing protein [Hydrogenophilales bacterium]